MMFVIISVGKLVYVAKGEEYDGMKNGNCDKKKLVYKPKS